MSAPSASIVALVESDGLFEGRRTLRLPLTDDLGSFQEALMTALKEKGGVEVDVVSPKDVQMEIYNSKTQAFQLMDQVPKSSKNCRVRITLRRPALMKDAPSSASPSQQQHSQPLLALPWKEFDVDLTDGSFLVNNRPLRIQEVTNAGLGTGLNVWDGSIALTRYLETHAHKYISNKMVLEVGAGTGLVGIAAGMMKARRVIVTDLEYSIENLKDNIRINEGQLSRPRDDDNASKNTPVVEAMILDWFHPESFELWMCDENDGFFRFDTILASDVVWVDELVLPLVRTLEFICNGAVDGGQNPPVVLMSYQCRSSLTETFLLRTLKEHTFDIAHIPKEEVKSERIQIFRITYMGGRPPK